MGNALKYAGSSYLKLADLHDKPPVRGRISYAKEETGKYGDRLVLFFESGQKLSLNATSVGVLCRDLGADFDMWTGHDIEVYAGEVSTKNGMADAILVRVLDSDTPLKPPPPAKGAAKAKPNDMDDEIPF